MSSTPLSAAQVCCGVFVVPLFGWCDVKFDINDPWPGDVKHDPRGPASDRSRAIGLLEWSGAPGHI